MEGRIHHFEEKGGDIHENLLAVFYNGAGDEIVQKVRQRKEKLSLI